MARNFGFTSVDPRTTAQDRASALDRIALEFGGKERELRRAIDTVRENMRYGTDVQNRYARIGDERLAEIGRQLNETLGGNTERISNLWGETENKIGGFYDQTAQDLSSRGSQIQGDVSQTARQLGLDNSGADEAVMAELAQQLQNIQQQQGVSRGTALSGAANLGGTFGSSAIQAESDAAREVAGNRTGLLRQVQAAIADIGRTGSQQQYDVLGQLSDLAAMRGQAQRVALEDVTQGRIDRERQARLDELASMLQQGALELQNKQLGLQREESIFNRQIASGNLEIQRAQLELQKRQVEAALNAQPNPYEEAKLRLELDRIQSQIDKNRAQTAKTISDAKKAKPKTKYANMTGVHQYLKDKKLPSNHAGTFNNLMQYARGQKPISKLGPASAKKLVGVGTAMNQEQGYGRLVNTMIKPPQRPLFHTLYEIYKGRF